MPLFGNTSKESLILQENRLTRIESTVQETRMMVLVGLGFMIAGAYSLVKIPIDALTKRVDIANGRTQQLEAWRTLHDQQSLDRRLYERIKELENWRNERDRVLSLQNGITLGRNQMWAVVAGLAVGIGSTIWALVQIFDKVFPQGI